MSLLDAATGAQPNTPQPATAPPDDSEASGGSGQPLKAEDVGAMQQALQSSIPPAQADAFQRVMVAGQKVLYSPDTSDMLKEELQSDEPIDKKLAGATGGLMSLLNQQSQGSIPPAIIIPAGAGLLLDIVQVLIQSGQQVTDQDVRDGLDQFSALIQTHSGIAPDAVAQNLGAGAQQPGAAPDASSVPAGASGGPRVTPGRSLGPGAQP